MEMIEGFESAIAVLVEKVTMCEFYAGTYVGVQLPSGSAELQRMLSSALPEFYATVIVFVVKARSYFEAGSTNTYYLEYHCHKIMLNKPSSAMKKFTSTLKSFNIEFQPLIEEMNTKEEVVSKYAGAATMDRIRGTILWIHVGGYDSRVQFLIQAFRDQRYSSEYYATTSRDYATTKLSVAFQ